ncbi:MAG: response regulator [Deltaproteobacteria bacterium]|nr:response regulator [Deltaproteobacteria bacterium]
MPKVLIVDDSAWARTLARQVVEGIDVPGLEVCEAADGVVALESMTVDPPDLVVLDLVLPGMHGDEVLRQARRAGFRGKVVVLTADVQDATRAAMDELGVDGFVTKPLVGATVEALADHLRRHLEARGAQGDG